MGNQPSIKRAGGIKSSGNAVSPAELTKEPMMLLKEIVSAVSVLLPSCFTCLLFRLAGHKIGKNTNISIFSYVYADDTTIGNDVDIRPFVFIRVKKLCIGHSSIISFASQIKGENSFTTKGNNFIGIHCLINCEEDVSMGFYSGLGPRSMVYSHGSFLPVTMGYPAKFEKIIIEDYVWVGMGVILLPGTHIESNCIINPGVVLKSRVPSNSLIEVKSNIFSIGNVRRLQTFLKKSTPDHLVKMMIGFLTYYQMDHIHDAANKCFSVQKSYVFKYIPETDVIELLHGDKKITYDFKNFFTDPAKLEIHRQFLFFLRRRYGVIFQTRYK